MMPFGFYSLASLWLTALFPAVILFYFLKLRRPRVEVPSLVLWHRVMEDRRVNSPFQRFKRNILLFLQLFLLALLILAAMQPYLRRRPKPMRRLPVLVDCSASMGALEGPGGVPRIERAKARVRDLVDNLLPDQELCLLSFAATARRRTDFTNNRRVLHEALDSLRVEDVPSDLEEAMQVVQALLRQAAFDEVVVISDGNVPPRVDAELSFDINYQLVGEDVPNIGVCALNARSTEAGQWDVFAVLSGSGERPAACRIEVEREKQIIAEEDVVLTPGTPERLMFRVEGSDASLLTFRLRVDGFDALSADNVAYLPLPRQRRVAAYVSESLPAFRHALAAMAGVRLLTSADSGADLAVVDSEAGLAASVRVVLTIGVVPEGLRSVLRVVDGPTEVVDWRRDCGLLRHVQLRDVAILGYPEFVAGCRPGDVEDRGYDILAESSHGPLVLRREFPTRVHYALLFHPDRSTLPYRVGFPILVTNTVAAAREISGLGDVEAPVTGSLPVIRGAGGASCRVRDPAGGSHERRFNDRGTLEGIPAPTVGLYRIETGTTEIRTGVSLLSEQETTLACVQELAFREDLSVSAAVEPVKAEQPLWYALALLGYAFLLIEWWWYQRKTG